MAVDPADFAKLADRVSELEGQVAALQHPLSHGKGSEPAAGRSGPALDAETFWALEGLKDRSGHTGAVLLTGAARLPDGPVEWQQQVAAESLLDGDWSVVAEALAALGQPVRLSLLRGVLGGTHTVAELGALEDVGTSGQLYHHLRALTATGWLRSTGRGRYEVPAARVIPLLVVIAAAQR